MISLKLHCVMRNNMTKIPSQLTVSENSPLFDNRFTFGVATSAFQIEGSISADGKVPSIWDTFCEQEGAIVNGDSGKLACDHFNVWKKDIELMKSLNIEAYRLSISWPRIISSLTRKVNPKGLSFYRKIIDCLLANGIKPYVTLYHWDLPQYLQDAGGWQSRRTAEEFAFYADVVSKEFGDEIVGYTTFNEPWVTSILGHLQGIHAPGIRCRKAAYHSAHYQLLAHGLALPLLRKNAPNSVHGIVINGGPCQAVTSSSNDLHAANIAYQEQLDLFVSPLLKGEYPKSLLDYYQEYFPENIEKDLLFIKQPIDYLGINYYTRSTIKATLPSEENCFAYFDGVVTDEYEKTAMNWDIYPQGLTQLIKQLNKDYVLPPVMIMENGVAFDEQIVNGNLDDSNRIQYFQSHLEELEKLMLSGIKVDAYFAWSFLDNFEWAEGYAKTFGLVHVDFTTQKRTPKSSAYAFGDLLQQKAEKQQFTAVTEA